MTSNEPSGQRRRSTGERALRAVGVTVGAGSCLPMLAMLPGGIAAGLSVVGVKATAGPAAPLARFLAPAAQPLLVLGIAALVVATLRCGLRPALLAFSGGGLLYLSMYVLPATSGAGMADMTGPAHSLPATAARAGAQGMTNGPVFFLGLAALAATFLWSGARRQRTSCRPVHLRLRSLSS